MLALRKAELSTTYIWYESTSFEARDKSIREEPLLWSALPCRSDVGRAFDLDVGVQRQGLHRHTTVSMC